VRHCYLGVDLA